MPSASAEDDDLYGATPPPPKRSLITSGSIKDFDRPGQRKSNGWADSRTNVMRSTEQINSGALARTPCTGGFRTLPGLQSDSTGKRAPAADSTISRTAPSRKSSGFRMPAGFQDDRAAYSVSTPTKNPQRSGETPLSSTEVDLMSSYTSQASSNRKRRREREDLDFQEGLKGSTFGGAPPSSMFVTPEPRPLEHFDKVKAKPRKKPSSQLGTSSHALQSNETPTQQPLFASNSSSVPPFPSTAHNPFPEASDPVLTAFTELQTFMSNLQTELMPLLHAQARDLAAAKQQIRSLQKEVEAQRIHTNNSFRNLTDATNKSFDELTERVDDIERVSDDRVGSDQPVAGGPWGGPRYKKRDREPGIFSGYVQGFHNKATATTGRSAQSVEKLRRQQSRRPG